MHKMVVSRLQITSHEIVREMLAVTLAVYAFHLVSV